MKYNDIGMYSPHNEGKVSYCRKISINRNTYHRTIEMNPIEIKDNTDVDSIKEVNNKDPKFLVGDHVRISKYKNSFAKGYSSN